MSSSAITYVEGEVCAMCWVGLGWGDVLSYVVLCCGTCQHTVSNKFQHDEQADRVIELRYRRRCVEDLSR